jgi:glutathionyl-hydroquinone reductase
MSTDHTPAAHLAALGVAGDPDPLLARIESLSRLTDQSAYESAYAAVFESLDALDVRLAASRFLGGAEPSDSDWRLYVVLLQFDPTFYGLYKLNRTRLVDFEQLGPWLRDLHQRSPVDWDLRAAVDAVYDARRDLNPRGIAPRALPDLLAPHDRHRFDAEDLRDAGTARDEAATVAGQFVRGASGFRGRIDVGEPGRYHLYIANNCPWCHRVALARGVKGLTEDISVGVLYFRRHAERGWEFRADQPGFAADEVNGVTFIKELYEQAGSTEGSVPVLWDKREGVIVSNESADIVRMIDDAWPDRGPRLAPPELLGAIDQHNQWIYRDINNGAYKAGFARSQSAYDHAFDRFFAGLDCLERIFGRQRFLCGERFTEADLRLFPTLFRFDAVYYTRFRLNRSMLWELPGVSRWLAEVLALPGVAESSNLDHCKQGYFGRTGNGIVPLGPVLPG